MKMDTDGFEAFCRRVKAEQVVRWLVYAKGASPENAEDAVQAAFMEVDHRWPELDHPPAYLYRVAKNKLFKLGTRSDRDLDFVSCASGRLGGPDRTEDTYGLDPGFLQDCLGLLTTRQREVMVLYLEGLPPREIGDLLAVTAAGVRAHLRDARSTLRDALTGKDDLHWRAGRATYERMRRGSMPDFGLRPVICQSWTRARSAGVRADRGTAAALLSLGEVRERLRELSWAETWVLESLNDLARAHDSMSVVLDGDGFVLARDGVRDVCRAADDLLFVEGASWLEETVGTNAAGLALKTGLPAAVSGPEHYLAVASHHEMSCWASPIRNGAGEICGALNLTARTGRRRGVRRHILMEVDALARRVSEHLRRQQRT